MKASIRQASIRQASIITAAALLTGSVALAGTEYSPQFNSAYTLSNETSDASMVIEFLESKNCAPLMSIVRNGIQGEDQEYEAEFKARIDRREPWDVDSYVKLIDGVEYSASRVPQSFINELRRGNTLRVKIQLEHEDYVYYSFNLMGFSKAYSKAKNACKSNQSYFNESNTNSNRNELYL